MFLLAFLAIGGFAPRPYDVLVVDLGKLHLRLRDNLRLRLGAGQLDPRRHLEDVLVHARPLVPTSLARFCLPLRQQRQLFIAPLEHLLPIFESLQPAPRCVLLRRQLFLLGGLAHDEGVQPAPQVVLVRLQDGCLPVTLFDLVLEARDLLVRGRQLGDELGDPLGLVLDDAVLEPHVLLQLEDAAFELRVDDLGARQSLLQVLDGGAP